MRPMTFAAAILALTIATSMPGTAADPIKSAVLYKDPDCGCCQGYADYLRQQGISVKVVNTRFLADIKRRHGVPAALEGCHTTEIGGYVVEGHVPIATLNRLLIEKPAIKGVSLPGMPEGSPGMSGSKAEPFAIYELSGDGTKLYARE